MPKILLAALLALIFVSPAYADAPLKVFVASTGSDANDGGRLTPKRSFQAAHDTVAAGGGVVVLDTAGYGSLTITKSLTITVPPGVSGFATVAGNSNAIVVNAGATDTVALRGLNIEGDSTGNSNFGILLNSGANVLIEDCTIRGVNNAITIAPSSPMSVTVRGGSIRGTNFGVYVRSSGTAAVSVVVSDMLLDKIGGQALGARVFATTAPTSFIAKRSIVSNSNIAVEAQGQGATIVADDCTFSSDATVFQSVSSGVVGTRGNNSFLNNGSLGSTPTPFSGG